MRLTAAALALALALPAPVLAQQETGADPLPYDAAERGVAATALQSTLYELLALRQHVHQMHWNVVGEEFRQLHEFYEDLYRSLDEPIDRLGARLRAVGVPADARPSQVVAGAGLSPPPTGLAPGELANGALLTNYVTVSERLEERVGAFEDDLMTQDLLIGIGRMIQKQAWMLRAHTVEN
jgi:starvation-inducible DNA-binding protein